MTFPLDRASITLVLELAIWALRSLVLAGVAGVGLAAFRPRTTALRLFVWTSVLYASIALPAVNWIVPALRVPMPNFLQPRTARIEHADIQNSANAVPEQKTVTSSPRSLKAPTGTPAALVSNSVPTGLHANRSLAGSRSVFLSFRWQELVAATYLVVAIFFLIRFAARTSSFAMHRRSRIPEQPRSWAFTRTLRRALQRQVVSRFLSPLAYCARRFCFRRIGTLGKRPSSTPWLRMNFLMLRVAIRSRRPSPCSIAQSSGSTPWPGGSACTLRTWLSRPVMSRHYPAERIEPTTHGLCWDFLRTCKPHPDESAGRAFPWPGPDRPSSGSNEFLPGRGQLP